MSAMHAATVAWVASAVAKETPYLDISKKNHTRATFRAVLENQLNCVGLQSLTIKELKGVWKNLRHEQFVLENDQGFATSIPSQSKKDVWVAFLNRHLGLPGALQLKPFALTEEAPPVAATATAAAAAAANPPATTVSVATMPHPYGQYDCLANINNIQSQATQNHMRSMQYHCMQQRMQQQHQRLQQHQRMQQQQGMRHIIRNLQVAHAPNPATNRCNNSQYPVSGQKRKATDRTNDLLCSLALSPRCRQATAAAAAATITSPAPGLPSAPANLEGAFARIREPANAANNMSGSSTDSGDDGPRTPLEKRLFLELQQMGFQDKKECLEGIRKVMAEASADEPPTTDAVMLAIIVEREENALSKDMDAARILSEQETKKTSEELREVRRLEQEERLLGATYTEFLNPTKAEDHKLMFPTSWLLRHPPSKTLLTDIVNNRDLTETKKSLIGLLRLERKSRQWYAGDFAKPYFTWVIGKRLLAATGSNELKLEMDKIVAETEEATSLPSKQDRDGKPLVMVKARDDYPSTKQPAGESSTAEDKKGTAASAVENDDDDSDIIELTEEEIRQLQAKCAKGKLKSTEEINL